MEAGIGEDRPDLPLEIYGAECRNTSEQANTGNVTQAENSQDYKSIERCR